MGKTRKSKKQSRQKQKDKRRSQGKQCKEANADAPAFVPAGDAPSREITRLTLRNPKKPPVKELKWHIEVVWGDELYAVAVKTERNMALIAYVASQQREQQRESWLGRAETIEGVSPGDVAKFYSDLSKEKGWHRLKPAVILAYWRGRFRKQSRVYQWCNGRLRKRFRKGPKGRILSPDAAKLLDRLFCHSSSDAKTAKLGLGALKSTWVFLDEEETYRVNAPKVLEAMRRHRLGKSWNKKPFRWVERTYVARQGGHEVDTFSSIKKLLKFILGHDTANLFVIHSESSLGKSMLLIELALHMLKNEDAKKFAAAVGIIPLYVEAYRLGKNWEDSLAKVLGPLPRFEVRGLEKAFMGNASEDDRRLFVQEISGKRKNLAWSRALVLLIDGVNEARDSTFFTQLGSEFPGCKKIIATRDPLRTILPKQPPGYCIEIELLPFSASQTREFCDRVDESVPAAARPEHEKWMPTLVHSPMLLRFYLSLEPEIRKGIASRYALYESVFENIKETEHDKFEDLRKKADAELPVMPVEVLYSVLPAISYEALSLGRSRIIDRNALASIVRSEQAMETLQGHTGLQLRDALKHYRTFVASIGDAGQLEYCHEEFCHYLAARHIVDTMIARNPDAVCRWLQRPSCADVLMFLGGAITGPSVLEALCGAFERNRRSRGDLRDEVNKAVSWDLQVWAELLQHSRTKARPECMTAFLSHVEPLLHESGESDKAVSIIQCLPRTRTAIPFLEDIVGKPDVPSRVKDAAFESLRAADSGLCGKLLEEMLSIACGPRWRSLLELLIPHIQAVGAVPKALPQLAGAIKRKDIKDYWRVIRSTFWLWKCVKEPEIVDAVAHALLRRHSHCEYVLLMIYGISWMFPRHKLPPRIRPAVLDLIKKPPSKRVAFCAMQVAEDFRLGGEDVHTALAATGDKKYPFPEVADYALLMLERLGVRSGKASQRCSEDGRRAGALEQVVSYIMTGHHPSDLASPMVEFVLVERAWCERLLERVFALASSDVAAVRSVAYAWAAWCVAVNPVEAAQCVRRRPRMKRALLAGLADPEEEALRNAMKCLYALSPQADEPISKEALAILNGGGARKEMIDLGLYPVIPGPEQWVVRANWRSRFAREYRNAWIIMAAASLGGVEETATMVLDKLRTVDSVQDQRALVWVLEDLRPLLYDES